MGALFLSSTSVFVSCKDYDDDISKNTSDIAALQTQLSTLQSALEQAKADAAAAHAVYATKTSLDEEIARLKQELLNADATQKAELEKRLAALESIDFNEYLTKSEAEAKYALQTEIAKLATAEALQKAIDDLNAAIAGKTSDLEAIATEIAAIDERLITVESWKNRLEALETALPVCEQNVANQQKALQQLIEILLGNGDEEEAAAVRAAMAEITAEAEGLDEATLEALKKKMEKISEVVDNVAPNANVITALVSHELKSIVLNPAYYINGIEAVTVPALKNYPLWEKGTNNEYTISGTSKLNVSLSGVAEYHLNPSSANILDYKIGFYGNKAIAITRSGENFVTPDSTAITEDYLKNTNLYNKSTGILKVGFRADVTKIAGLANDELPMIALELTKGDTIVTSDYALVEPLEYTNFRLADKVYLAANKDKSDAHMNDYKQPKYADINNEHLHTDWRNLVSIDSKTGNKSARPEEWAATVEFRYDQTLDLGARIATHHDLTDVKGTVTKDKTLSDNDFTALGLVYKYETVDYLVGDNNTSESAHISVDENGIVTPHSVNEKGEPGENFNRAAIGKLPIVRVLLEDGEGNVLAIGYYKLKIVDKVTDPVTPDTPDEDAPLEVTVDETFYANCVTTGPWLTKTLKWSEVEAMIYAALNVSKEEFEAQYEILENKLPHKGTTDADQFTYEVKNGKHVYTQKTAANKIGLISEIADPNNPTTNTLKWDIYSTPTDWLNLWSQNNWVYVKDDNGKVTAKVTKEDIETIVCYKNKYNDKSIYVRFTIPAGQIHFATADITSGKALAQWYQQFSHTNAVDAGDAYEVATAVGNPTQSYQKVLVNDFTKDLHNYFMNNSLEYTLTEAKYFDAFVNKNLAFQFTTPKAADGNATAANEAKSDGTWEWKGLTDTYTLKVGSTNRTIQVTKVNGTALPTPVDIITLNTKGEVQYIQGTYADDLLNGYGRTERGERQTLTAFVKIVVDDPSICYPLDMTGTEYFNVRFIRPVNLMGVEPYGLLDAPNDYQFVNLADLVTIQDWRNYECINSIIAPNYPPGQVGYDFYSIEIRSDIDDILTDAHLGTGERSADYDPTKKSDKDKLTEWKNIHGLKLKILSTEDTTDDPANDSNGNILRYNYNGSELGTFHLFVPVYVKYVFAQDKKSWQHAYAVITVSATASARQK